MTMGVLGLAPRARVLAKACCGLAAAIVLAAASVGLAQEVPSSRAEIALSFAPVVHEAAPAVVNMTLPGFTSRWTIPRL